MNCIVLFRDDLRLLDNPALSEASIHTILPVYMPSELDLGNNTQDWLSNSLEKLNESLDGHLISVSDTKKLFALIQKYNIQAVYWNRRYAKPQIEADKALKAELQSQGIEAHSFNGNLLFEPWTVLKPDDTHYAVYTPFYKQCRTKRIRDLYEKPKLNFIQHKEPAKLPTPKTIDVETGEKEAHRKLKTFLSKGLKGYKVGRDFPAKPHTSQLSAHLRFGEISPHYVWSKIEDAEGLAPDSDLECFQKELIWREFAYYQLFHFPDLPNKNWNAKFDHFKWKRSEKHLKAWQQGETGIPIIDAAMRCLSQTGHMHNRLRMITASFLTKNLGIHWKAGEEWFWDHLYDADCASNNASWQWVAGTGADAAPYFRIFNPILQSSKFDPEGEFIHTYLPELKDLPISYLHEPHTAPLDILEKANITLGKDYPKPIIDLKASRDAALQAYQDLPAK